MDKEKSVTQTIPNNLQGIDKGVTELFQKLEKTYGDGTRCFPFFMAGDEISKKTVDKVYDELQNNYEENGKCDRLVVIVDSGGGDIDAAYNLALLFRRYAQKELKYIVPRWAKSAATLLVCGGDSVSLTPVAELGPLDPQITVLNTLEQRLEEFSPLHIESTLEMIRNEFINGNKELANGLLQRLQFPITLGSFTKSLEVGKQYAEKLLGSRMLKQDQNMAKSVADKLVHNYADHGFCINIDEAASLGLKIDDLTEDQINLVWTIHKYNRKKAELIEAKRRKETKEVIKNLPPDILEKLPGITSPKIQPKED